MLRWLIKLFCRTTNKSPTVFALRFRVRTFTNTWWVVEYSYGGLSWEPVPDCSIDKEYDSLNNKNFPLLYKTFDEADRMARKLSGLGEWERYSANQEAKWNAGQVKVQEFKKSRERVNVYKAG